MTTTTIGILGGGQLGRMLALAGYPLGLRFRFLEPDADAPAGHLAEHDRAGYDDPATLERFAAGVDLISYEFENVPVVAARRLAERVPVYPPPAALDAAQDRLAEKRFFQELGVATPPFAPVGSRAELAAAVAQIGLPAVLKTRRLGYDGKGQFVLRTPADIGRAWAALGGAPLIVEGFIAFRRELSILAARGRAGAIAFYPLVENHHRAGILRLSLAPAPALTPALQAEAEQIAAKALEALDYVGILAIELFEVRPKNQERASIGSTKNHVDTVGSRLTLRVPVLGSGLLVNEMAPRVHNSGHWTIEGAETSQFEQHLRAVLGLPLGSTALRGVSAMVNLIGVWPERADVLAIPGAHLHLYGKAPRAGRKLGHVTVRGDDERQLKARLAQVQALVRQSENEATEGTESTEDRG
jgi:5-(carboxyamino)imidazole ribonucleotide synthase